MPTVENNPFSLICDSCGEETDSRADSSSNCGTKIGITITNYWQAGVYVATVAWTSILLIISIADFGETTQGYFMLFLTWFWVFMPICFYYDTRYVKAVSDWRPPATMYILGSLIPIVNIYLGFRYHTQREENLGVELASRHCLACLEDLDEDVDQCWNCGTHNAHLVREGDYKFDPLSWNTSLFAVVILLIAIVFNDLIFLSGLKQGLIASRMDIIYPIAWISLPVTLVLDMRHVREHSKWAPNRFPFILGSIIPIVQTAVVIAYLFRRHEVLGTP